MGGTMKDLEKRFTKKELDAINRAAREEAIRLSLRELRQLSGTTQRDLADATKFSQGDISLLERREDHLLSTLRRYVEGLGGELEVVAHLGNKRVTLVGV